MAPAHSPGGDTVWPLFLSSDTSQSGMRSSCAYWPSIEVCVVGVRQSSPGVRAPSGLRGRPLTPNRLPREGRPVPPCFSPFDRFDDGMPWEVEEPGILSSRFHADMAFD